VNVSSSLAQLRNLTNPYRERVSAAKTVEDLCSISFDPHDDPSARSGIRPTYSLSKAMLNRATQVMAQRADFNHLSVNAADPGWVR